MAVFREALNECAVHHACKSFRKRANNNVTKFTINLSSENQELEKDHMMLTSGTIMGAKCISLFQM